MNQVLVADADEGTRQAYSGVLRLYGCQVEAAATGRECVALAARGGFDLFLVDLRLPDLSGVAVTQQLRAMGVRASIVITTVFPESDFGLPEAMAAGASGYRDTPISADDLTHLLLGAIGQGRLPEAAGLRVEPMPIDPVVAQIIKFIDRAPGDTTSIADLARRFGLSESRLRHRFVGVTGLSISRFRSERRLRQAAHLLATTSDPFIRLARYLGFGQDVRRARQRFRERFGVSPQSYRARCVRL